MSAAEPLFSAVGLGKTYAGPVLRDVALELFAGQVHAIVGENGAGKSTLARILAGLATPDQGAMRLRGQRYAPRDLREARDLGVGIVHQELSVIPTLTVAEALLVDRLPAWAGIIDRHRLRAEAAAALAQVGLEALPPDRLVAALSLAERQLVEIAAVLHRQCAVLVLDEPTAALAPAEAERLFAELHRLRSQGTAIVFISHRLEEVARLADRTSVLRDGALVASRPAAHLDRDEMVRLMVGRPLAATRDRGAVTVGDTVLRVEGLSGRGFENVSFAIRRGEVLGLAGLVGAGRTEVLRAIFGADAKRAGKVYVGAATSPAVIGSPRDAVRLGIAFLPEDRKSQGLLLPSSVRTNVTLGHLSRAAGRLGLVRRDREDGLARPFVESTGVRARSLDQVVRELSGGNQQKVLLARSLLRDPEILLLDEPTRGIDVGARAEVHRLLLDLAARGKAIVVASSELPELLELADRMLVFCRGRLAATFTRGGWSAEAIMAAAVGDAEATATRTA